MAISFYCPLGDAISFPDERAGQRELCPVCGVPVIVPAAESPAANPAAGSPANPPPLPDTTAAPRSAPTSSPGVPPPPRATPPVLPAAPPVQPPPAAPPVAAVPPAPPPELSSISAHVAAEAMTSGGLPLDLGRIRSERRPSAAATRRPATTGALAGDMVAADPVFVRSARGLAIALAVVALVSSAPSLLYPNLATAPDWAKLGLLIGGVQLAYVGWLASLPDWSTVWFAMVAFALTGALYAVAMAAAALTPVDQVVPFELTDVRRVARLWCGIVVLLSALMCYFAGRLSYRWRRAITRS